MLPQTEGHVAQEVHVIEGAGERNSGLGQPRPALRLLTLTENKSQRVTRKYTVRQTFSSLNFFSSAATFPEEFPNREVAVHVVCGTCGLALLLHWFSYGVPDSLP
jgi:hypothetical protein